MKIAFDAQLLFENQKTGIGWNAKMMIDHLLLYPDVECILNCFLMRDPKRAEVILKDYRQKGCIINQSSWMPGRIYNHLERILPLPYKWVFGTHADITQFFNYTIPFGVSGKRITIVHDMAFRAFPETVAKRTERWLKNNLEKYCRRADVILTVSEFSRQEIQRYMGIPTEKIEVIYNGVDMERYHPGYTVAQIGAAKSRYRICGSYILYLGTLEPRKNIETLITAYNLLKKEIGSDRLPKLVLAGKKGWMYETIFTLVQNYGLENDVIFTGYVDEEDVPVLLCGAHIFAFPSLYEGFGIPPLEAMACGTPVITSNTSSLPEIVGEAGILIPPMDAEGLKRSMQQLLTDEVMRQHYIKAGLKQVREFTWARSAEKLVDIYRKLCSPKKNLN